MKVTYFHLPFIATLISFIFLQSMLQGHLDMSGAVVDLLQNPDRVGLEWVLRIVTSTACTPFEVAVHSKELVNKKIVPYLWKSNFYKIQFTYMILLQLDKKLIFYSV